MMCRSVATWFLRCPHFSHAHFGSRFFPILAPIVQVVDMDQLGLGAGQERNSLTPNRPFAPGRHLELDLSDFDLELLVQIPRGLVGMAHVDKFGPVILDDGRYALVYSPSYDSRPSSARTRARRAR